MISAPRFPRGFPGRLITTAVMAIVMLAHPLSAEEEGTGFLWFSKLGQGTPEGAKITWCGREWIVRATDTPEEPGSNRFVAENVHIDSDGKLHLYIRWLYPQCRTTCAELFTTETVGYGRYSFTLQTNPSVLPYNVVLGLFTYDEDNCNQMHSEIDIEFTHLGLWRVNQAKSIM